MIGTMRLILSYFLLLTLALSGLTGSVQTAHAYTLADAISQKTTQQQTANTDSDTAMPCHSAVNSEPVVTEHNCCDQPQHQCEVDCCAKHCATAGALLAAELFRYIRPNSAVAQHTVSLPQWLFVADPPPPINA